jgi:hypothetical protein
MCHVISHENKDQSDVQWRDRRKIRGPNRPPGLKIHSKTWKTKRIRLSAWVTSFWESFVVLYSTNQCRLAWCGDPRLHKLNGAPNFGTESCITPLSLQAEGNSWRYSFINKVPSSPVADYLAPLSRTSSNFNQWFSTPEKKKKWTNSRIP